MTGKLFIGGVEPDSLGEIDRLYAGDELMWPSVPAIPTYLAEITIGSLQVVLNFGPRFVNSTRAIDVNAPTLNTHPAVWDTGGSTMHARATGITSNLNDTILTLTADGVPMQEGVWYTVASGFGRAVVMQLASNNLAGGNTGWAQARFELSRTANGGNIVYDAISRVSMFRLPT